MTWAWLNPWAAQQDLRGQWEGEPEPFDPNAPDMYDYLRDILAVLESIEKRIVSVENAVDKLVALKEENKEA